MNGFKLGFALLTIVCVASSPATAQTAALHVTTRGSAATGPEVDQNFEGNEILVEYAGQLAHHRNAAAIAAFLGDVDGNGTVDDHDGLIDALAPPPGSFDGGLCGLLISFDRNVGTLSGTIEDGDIVSIGANGFVVEHFDESFFANVTSTSSIDVDAFHIEDDGTIYFSFASDETTTSTALTAQNGGDSTLDETTVFVIGPQDTEASILFDRSTVLAMVNQAMGTSLSSVVDVTGISPDPQSVGDWLFCLGSSNSVIEGRVFTSAGGGGLATFGGLAIDSNRFGFATEEILEGLAIADRAAAPLTLYGPDVTLAPAGHHAYEVTGATPHTVVQYFASHTLLPAPPTESFPAASGFPWLLVNSSDPFLYLTLGSLDFADWADADGRARVSFDLNPLPTGLRITMQAVDLASLRICPPVTAFN